MRFLKLFVSGMTYTNGHFQSYGVEKAIIRSEAHFLFEECHLLLGAPHLLAHISFLWSYRHMHLIMHDCGTSFLHCYTPLVLSPDVRAIAPSSSFSLLLPPLLPISFCISLLHLPPPPHYAHPTLHTPQLLR